MTVLTSPVRSKKIVINKTWCKGCGICAALCSGVLIIDSSGKAAVVNAAQCTACGKCITHCPDFAISIRED